MDAVATMYSTSRGEFREALDALIAELRASGDQPARGRQLALLAADIAQRWRTSAIREVLVALVDVADSPAGLSDTALGAAADIARELGIDELSVAQGISWARGFEAGRRQHERRSSCGIADLLAALNSIREELIARGVRVDAGTGSST